MKKLKFSLVCVAMLLAMAGCGALDDNKGGEDPSGDPGEGTDASIVLLEDLSNYA